MIRVQGLVKSFGSQVVLRQLDLAVAQGECLAIVGPNGAGKTTLLRILSGLSLPTAGQAEVAGLALGDSSEEARRQIGFLSHQPLLHEHLSAEQNLRFFGLMYDVPRLAARVSELLRYVGLAAHRHGLVRTFSRGMKQRLAIARALLHEPPVLLLDEPYTGLDIQAEEMLDGLLRERAGDRCTILFTTHNLDQALRLGTRIAMLTLGRLGHQMDQTNWDPAGFREAYRRETSRGT